MRIVSLAALAIGLAFAAAPAFAVGGADDDAKRLQGVWVIDPATYKDEKDPEAVKQMKAVRIIFEGDALTVRHPPGNEEKGPFTLDPGKRPKQIDLGGNAKGIYELDGDSLKLCWDADANTNGRPTKFASDNTKDRVTWISQMTRSFRHDVCAFFPENPAFPAIPCRNDRGTQ